MSAQQPALCRAAIVAVFFFACFAALGLTSAGAAPGNKVVIPPGGHVEIALAVDPAFPSAAGVHNAVQMALQRTPSIDGFPVQLVGYTAPCSSVDAIAANAAAARAVVANGHIVAVVGHECSVAFGACGAPGATSALSIYQHAGMPTINGSTTNVCLLPIGPTVFNRTVPTDPAYKTWREDVVTTADYKRWSELYFSEFRAFPPEYAAAYYDATSLLLSRIGSVAVKSGSNLVIDRTALARAIRSTRNFQGATCIFSIDPKTGNRGVSPINIPNCGKGP